GNIIKDANGKPVMLYGNCDWNDVILAVKNIVKWGTIIALQFSVVVIAYAGFLFMTSGDNPNKRDAAKRMLWKIVLGIVFILSAWLIVTLITNNLLNEEVRKFVPLSS